VLKYVTFPGQIIITTCQAVAPLSITSSLTLARANVMDPIVATFYFTDMDWNIFKVI